MKNKNSITSLVLAFASLVGVSALNAAEHDHLAHAGHDHAAQAEKPSGHDHAAHAEAVTAPNGGRLIRSVSPYAEFFVTEDRFVLITFVDHDGAVVPVAEQTASLIGGDRSDPVRLSFEEKDGVLRSTEALPEVRNMPIVLQIKTSPDAKKVRAKFLLNMSECPSCSFKEYACVCAH